MKTKLILLFLPLVISCSHNKIRNELVVELSNNTMLERREELITISRDTLVKYMGEIKDDELLLVTWQLNTLPCQLDDLDKDGKWDELAFLGNFMPMERVKVLIERTKDEKLLQFQNKTNIRFAKIIKQNVVYEEADSAYRLKGFLTDSTQKYLQFEGPGWENDLVAFRNYFDERNGIDIFGKVTTHMILDSVGINAEYHVPQDWGMDILKVGNSLGAGSLGILYKDSLYRVSAVEGASFHIVAEGPVRSILDLDFKELNINGLTLGLKHRITIVPAKYGYESNVTFYNPSDSFLLVPGIVNMHSKTLYTDSIDKAEIIYTHDKQSFMDEYLGLGLVVNLADYCGSIKTPKTGEGITNTYAVKMKPNITNGNTFQFFACWEISNLYFQDKNVFSDYLKLEAKKFQSPVVINRFYAINKKRK